MRLSGEAIAWAIDHLSEVCHPFLGITFLAAKKAKLPHGNSIKTSLDALTRQHLVDFHRLDPDSEFFFQPFRSVSTWVATKYPSSGLQAINTQTFSEAFIHPKGSQNWGFTSDYVTQIVDRTTELRGPSAPKISAMAMWILKDNNFKEEVSIEEIIGLFAQEFYLTDVEVRDLFSDDRTFSSTAKLFDEFSPDLKKLAHSYGAPPDAPEETEGALTSLSLENVGPADSLFLEFGERLTVIAGDNGLGKSFLLDAAWWAITNSWASRAAFPFRSPRHKTPTINYTIRVGEGQEKSASTSFDWTSYSWKLPAEPLKVSALSIYAKVDGSFAVSDFVRGQIRIGHDSSLSFFSSEDVWEGNADEIEGLIRDWNSWQNDKDSGVFATLTRVLEHLSPDDIGPLTPGQPVRIPGNSKWIPTIRHSYGDVPITFASAGVRRVLILAYLIIWVWEEHKLAAEQIGINPLSKMVIIIDELEAHLHPKWQRLVLPALLSVGKLLSDELDVQLIAATHSPMVLASIEAEFSDDSDVLAHLTLSSGLVEIEPLDFYKYGDMSSWLTSPVFGLSHARSQRAGHVIDRAKSLQLSSNPNSDDVRSVTEELKKVLSPDDQFWNRWLFFAETFEGDK